MIKFLDLLARLMISSIFLFSGVNKIFNYDGTVGWMESFGVPGLLLVPAIIIEIIFPLLLIFGYKTKIAAALLFLFCISTAFIFHNDFNDQMQLTAFLKNIALAGGFMFLIANGAQGYSFDKK